MIDQREQYSYVSFLLKNIHVSINNQVYENIRLTILSKDWAKLESLMITALSNSDISSSFVSVLANKYTPSPHKERLSNVI